MKDYKPNYLLTLLILTVGLFISTACNSTNSKDDSTIAPSVDGTWASDVVDAPGGDARLEFDLNQSKTQVTGIIKVKYTQDNIDDMQLQISSGNYNYPDLTLNVNIGSNNNDESTFKCVVKNANTMNCKIPKSEQTSIDVELKKQ